MADQKRRGLSERDRDFIQGDLEYDSDTAKQQKSRTRKEIRERLVRTILDFQLVEEDLSDKQRKRIFSEPEENGAASNYELLESIKSLLAWLYLGCQEQDIDFETLLRRAIKEGEMKYAQKSGEGLANIDIEYDVTVERPDSDVRDLARCLEEGEPVRVDMLQRIPRWEEFPIDTSKVDTVRVKPSSGKPTPVTDRQIAETILTTCLDIDADVEVVGERIFKSDDADRYEARETPVVPPEEYE